MGVLTRMGPVDGPRLGTRRVVARLLLVTVLVMAGATRGAGTDTAIAVVVGHGQAETTPLAPALVAGIFARKRQLWRDRSPIVPVNLPASHPLRRNFSRWVFDRTPEQMQDYWNDQYFHGVVPPPVLASEEAVLRFVASTPGAIGYVSLCLVDRRVEVLAVIEAPEGAATCPH
jgi:ABC-type phosphate transport system substrate-binding protein